MTTKTIILDGDIRPQIWSGDLNGDGVHELAFSGFSGASDGLSPLKLLVSNGSEFTERQVLLSGQAFSINSPKLMFTDTNGDGRNELVVYDNAGWNLEVGSGVGHVPRIFGFDGQNFLSSNDLERAYLAIVDEPNSGQTDATVSFKDYDIADIDNDGDLDFWVESTGSMNAMGHFVVNQGARFEIDLGERLDGQLYFNSIPDFTTRWNTGRFHDVNGDGFVDLFLGTLDSRSNGNPIHSSVVLLNDGTGHFDNEGMTRLPRPVFNNGNSAVNGVSFGHIDGDGLKDAVIAHTHQDAQGNVTGTSLQVLLQNPDGTFTDRTTQFIPDQSVLVNSGQSIRNVTLQDINLDGLQDIFVDFNFSTLSASIPNYLINAGGQRFVTPAGRLYDTGAQGVETVLRNLDGDRFLDAVTIDYGDNFELYSEGKTRLTVSYGDEASLLSVFPERNNGETLSGTAGDDFIHGFGGVDTFVVGRKVNDIDGMLITAAGEGVVLVGPDGRDTLVGIERVRFTDGEFDLYGLRTVLQPELTFAVVRDGVAGNAQPTFFTGLQDLNLHYQLIDTTPDAIVVGSDLNDFIALQGGGVKAADGGAGDDVIDGGVGSTFVTGGSGSNTFFLDGRAEGVSWSTITDFQVGQDKATIWGWKAGVSRVKSIETDGGADGYKGITFHFENLLPDGSPDGAVNPEANSLTFTGRSLSDFGVSSAAELNEQILAGTADYFVVGQTEDVYGVHGYLHIA